MSQKVEQLVAYIAEIQYTECEDYTSVLATSKIHTSRAEALNDLAESRFYIAEKILAVCEEDTLESIEARASLKWSVPTYGSSEEELAQDCKEGDVDVLRFLDDIDDWIFSGEPNFETPCVVVVREVTVILD